ncbi:hypothetical protein [Methanohalobium sp.]|uniref:hypothetical protein n=1 Tax=Methanohalobium sp. TaxID=2837493 RepID=UPI0025EE5F63|nr:hypothetical protein [Methanohalobium sp.]
MAHDFQIIKNGKLLKFTRYQDIPKDFDNVVKFLPEIPPEPHTPEQHEEIEDWHNKFLRLMEIEKNGRSSR